uniref:Uncharacterized protein n=1 Tax=mine drainage metagenome TaxID=410659 RepID=E6QGN1_9ZZZZ
MTMLKKMKLGVVLGLAMVPIVAMAGNDVGTMVFMHATPANHFGSVSQVLIGPKNLGVESFYFGSKKVRIILTPTHRGKHVVGKRYVRIDVQNGRKTLWSDHRWIAIPTSHIVSLGDGYRFGIVVAHNPPGNMAHPTGKSAS